MNSNENLASLLKGLLDATPDLVFAKDLNYRYIAHNEAFLQLVGRPGEDLSGFGDAELFDDAAAIQRLRCVDENILLQQETIRSQEAAVYPDGRQVLLDTLKAPFYDGDGQTIGLLGISRDVTKRVAAEEAAVVEKENALQASLAKSEFLAKMSHEIRTPMNAVIGLSRLLAKTPLDDEQGDFVNKIITSADALLNIINDILDFSKIEAKQLSMECVPFNLQRVIDKTVTLCELKALEKNLELILDVASDAPTRIVGDPHRLQQVLVNLTSNAIKFTESGHVLLKISLDPAHGAAASHEDASSVGDIARLKFSISDSGIGISAAQQERLFKSFSQLDNSFTREFEGTGLGLVISKQLVELMGGDITVSSHLNQGSTFFFSIECPVAEAAEPARCGLDRCRNLKALVVDDSSIARAILKDMLVEMGLSVDCAENGREAVECVNRACDSHADYDLILMDWRMPELDGISAAKQIKQDLGKSHIPAILLLSAYDMDKARKMAVDAQIDAYLEKPVNMATLREVVFDNIASANNDAASNASERSNGDAVAIDLSESHILLVDDNAINRTVVKGLLAQTNVAIDIATDGLQALEKVESHDYDLILMDIQMPYMDGLTATKKIRENPRLAGLPIIAMTANAMQGDEQKSLRAGMNGHITKPIDPDRFYLVLEHWLKNLAPASSTQADTARHASGSLYGALIQMDELTAAQSLKRCQGNVALYESLVRDFVRDNQNIAAELTALAGAANDRGLYIKAHSLKASAAYIGAFELSTASADLEQAVHGGTPREGVLDSVCGLATTLLDRLSAVLGEVAAVDSSPSPCASRSLSTLLGELYPLLASSDFSAEDYFPELVKLSRHTEYAEQVDEMKRLVADIQFERAAEQCGILMHHCQ